MPGREFDQSGGIIAHTRTSSPAITDCNPMAFLPGILIDEARNRLISRM
jgi:hypothetical protein